MRPHVIVAATAYIRTVAVHYIMVSYPVESPGTMPPVDVGYCEILPRRSGGAMNKNGIYVAHAMEILETAMGWERKITILHGFCSGDT